MFSFRISEENIKVFIPNELHGKHITTDVSIFPIE